MPLVSPERFPFCGGTYAGLPSASGGSSPVFNSERSINFYPEAVSRDGHPKSRMQLIGRPGLALFSTLPLGPVRAILAGNAHLWAVGGTHFYELNADGSVKTDFGAMTGSLGAGPCQIINNGAISSPKSPNGQILVMDSSVVSGGTINGGVFFADSSFPAMIGPVFNGGALAYLDGFWFAISSAAGNSFISQINVSNFLDGSTAAAWNALNFVNRTGHSDPLIQLQELNQQLWMFGTKTTEIWQNAGSSTFPLVRTNTINLGLLAQFSVVQFFNSILWVAWDDRGYASVYRSQGLNAVRVSTPAVEYLLNNAGAQSAAFSVAYGYQEAGHTFYVLNYGSANNYSGNQGLTLCYDLTEGLWHERTSLAGGVQGLHRPQFSACVRDFSTNPAAVGSVFVGDFASGKIYIQSLAYKNDNGAAITYIRRSPHVSDGNRWVRYSSLELDVDIGSAQLQLDYSNDGGRSFPAAHQRGPLAASVDQGYGSAGGGFGRFKFYQLGRSRDRVFQTTIVDSINSPRIINANLVAWPGGEP